MRRLVKVGPIPFSICHFSFFIFHFSFISGVCLILFNHK